MDSRWVAGVCKGFERADITALHSASFLDGYDYGLELRGQIETGGSMPQVINARSQDVRGILEENRRLRAENSLLRGANTADASIH